MSVIRAVQFGETYVDPLLGDEVRKGSTPLADSVPQTAAGLGLTDREASVLKYSARGLTTKEIAARLELSGKTVETYKFRAAEKLGLKTRAEIVRFASAQGWLEEF